MVCMVYGIQIFSDLVREIETTAQFHNHLQQVRRYITLLRVNLLEGVSTISSLIVDIYILYLLSSVESGSSYVSIITLHVGHSPCEPHYFPC